MQDNDDSSWMDDDILPRPTPKDLRGRQSVRATFKLSAKAIEAISIVAVHLGIKQKSLFDHLIEDVHSLKLISLEVENITNTLYYQHLSYLRDPFASGSRVYEPGTTVRLNFRLNQLL